MDAALSPEINSSPEEFKNRTHLAPLEHILIGSSFDFPGERLPVNSSVLASNEDIINNSDLLKPLGLIKGELSKEQIRAGRKHKSLISSYFPCFKKVEEILRGHYAVDYKLASPDENGRIPNGFEFQFKPKSGDYDSSNADHGIIFNQIALHESLSTYGKDKPFFSLTSRNEQTGTFSVVFMPLADKVTPQTAK